MDHFSVAPNETYDIIMDSYYEFEKSLDDAHKAELRLFVGGTPLPLNVEAVGYASSDVLVFHGSFKGQKATLIQHVSQLTFLLTTVPRETGTPKEKLRGLKRIGFQARE